MEARSAISADARRKMVAEAAYFRAEARGFRGGDPVDDWLAAEAEVEQALLSDKCRREEAAYDRLRAEAQKGLAAIRDSVDAQVIQDAIERAANRAKKAGEYAAETINKAVERLKKDIAESAVAMGPRWESFSDKTANVFAVWRDRGGTFLARAAIGVGEWLDHTGRRLERVQYRAGETVDGGNFECLQCHNVIHLETRGPLSVCECGHSEFRRRQGARA